MKTLTSPTYMQMTKLFKIACLCMALLAFGSTASQAQNASATWTGASGGDWNNGANWDLGVPGVLTNSTIPTNIVVNYNSAMSSPSIGAVTNIGTLNVNAAGFNVDVGGTTAQSIILTPASKMTVSAGAAVSVTNSGVFFLNTNAVLTLNNATLKFTNSLANYDILVGRGGRNNGATVGFTNSTVVLNKLLAIQGGSSTLFPASGVYMSGGTLAAPGIVISNATDDAQTYMIVDGGANVQGGDLVVQRSFPTYGFILSNGVVNVTSLLDGTGASRAGVNIFGGILTNTGAFSLGNGVGNGTSDRKAYFYQRGGTVVATAASGLVIANTNGTGTTTTTIANQGAICDITGGTLTVEAIALLANNTIADVTARLNLGGSGTIYVGSGGIVANLGGSGSTATFSCTNGTVGAKADWSSSAAILVSSGTTVIQAADAAGTAHNITLGGIVSGSGGLKKTGAGTLTLTATNAYTGNTTISTGSLVLATNLAGSTGLILTSSIVSVSAGATFDVSQLQPLGGYVLLANKTISGAGTIVGAFAAGPSSIISPADNVGTPAQGTINFANGLAITNIVINMGLSDNPSGVTKTNDKVNVTGDFTVSGTNTINVTQINGVLGLGTYQLVKYSGNFIGDVSNLFCSFGKLTNAAGTKEIDLIVTNLQPVANLVWAGDGSANLWNTAGASNWLNGVNHSRFNAGDGTTFNDASASNLVVNLSGIVTPSSLLVAATNNFTFADGGGGDIFGSTSLIKTNSGKLTILTANDFNGGTTISGGTLSVSSLANGGAASPIGAASSDPANLVLNGGTLEYMGANVTIDRGATLQANGGTLNVSNSGVTVTISGSVTGPGVLTKIGNGTLVFNSAHDYAGGTVISAGAIRTAQGSAATITAFGTNTVTLSGVTTNAAYAFASDQQVLPNTLNIVGNNNLITNAGNETISGLTGNGTVTLEGVGGNVLTLQAADMSGFSGTIAIDTISNLRFLPSSGSTANAVNATFNLGSGAGTGFLNNKNGNFTARIGALVGGSNTQLQGASSPTTGTGSTYIIGNALNSLFSGTIVDGPSTTNGGPRKAILVKDGTGTLILDNNSAVVVTFDGDLNLVTNIVFQDSMIYSGNTTISNGVLALVTPSTPTNSPVFTLASTTAILDASKLGYVSNALDGDPADPLFNTATNYLVTNGTYEVISPQVFTGIGTVRGKVVADSGSTVMAGLSTGVLTVTNGIELAGTVIANLDVSKTPNCGEIVSPTITIDGTATLLVTNLGPEGGATFQLFNHPVSGFASVTLPTLTGTNTWENKLAVDGSLILHAPPYVAVNPLPGPIQFSFSGGGTVLNLSWPTNGGWTLEVQTNSLAVGINTNWFRITESASMTSTNFPVVATNGAVFYRLIYP